MTARLVIGLVIEQMRNIESVRIGLPASRSAMPCALNQATRPWRITSVTAPAIRLSSILRCTSVEILSNRSADRPTVSGFAVDKSCAKLLATATRITIRNQRTLPILGGDRCSVPIDFPPFHALIAPTHAEGADHFG